jgi:signal transduction histidine kinase
LKMRAPDIIAPISFTRWSISTRLALSYGLSMLLLLSGFVIFLYSSVHIGLHHDFENQLLEEALQLRHAVRLVEGVPELRSEFVPPSVAYEVEGGGGTFVRLLSPAGGVLYRSPSFGDSATFVPAPPPSSEKGSRAHEWRGQPVRSLYTPLTNERGGVYGWLETTRVESDLHRDLHRLAWLLTVGVLLGSSVAMGFGYWLARRALRPVADLTRATHRIRAENLEERLPVASGVHDEVTELAGTLNDLLARLDASFEREHRFRADAAHEMFTPISALQSEIEVTLRKDREAKEYRQTLLTLGSHTRRLSEIVEALLQLSRAESLKQTSPVSTDASEAARCQIDLVQARAEGKSIHLWHQIPPGLTVGVERRHLDTVVANLLDNAVKFTEEAGRVGIEVEKEDGVVVLRVSDTGAGFSEEESEHLFDRFYRADHLAVQKERGSGLGLSIVKAIVEAHGGIVRATSQGLGLGSTFEVQLPQC